VLQARADVFTVQDVFVTVDDHDVIVVDSVFDHDVLFLGRSLLLLLVYLLLLVVLRGQLLPRVWSRLFCHHLLSCFPYLVSDKVIL